MNVVQEVFLATGLAWLAFPGIFIYAIVVQGKRAVLTLRHGGI